MSIYIFPIGSVLWWTLTHLQFSIVSYTNGRKNRNLLTMHWTWVEHFLNKALLGSFDLYRRDSYSKNMLRKIFCTLVICAHVLLWYGFSLMISVVSFFLGIYRSFEYVKFKIRIRIEIKGLREPVIPSQLPKSWSMINKNSCKKNVNISLKTIYLTSVGKSKSVSHFYWLKWPYLQHTFMLLSSAEIIIQKHFKVKRNFRLEDEASELYRVISRGRGSLGTCCQ